tara:strand:+ start:16466 stop:17431 length:966 start_codon:yes stop_codon:yes gene_type:complete
MSIHNFPGSGSDRQHHLPDQDQPLVRRGTVTDIIHCQESGTTDYVVSNLTGCTRLRGILEQDGGTGGIPTVGAVVEVYGYPESLDGAEGVAVEFVQIPLNALSIEMIPMVLCPPIAKDAMHVITATIMSLSDDLRVFLSRVVARPPVATLLMKAPASLEAHDAYQGGLAVHVAGMLTRVLSLPIEDFQNAESREVLLAACILHDLGKVMTCEGGFSNYQTAHEIRLIGVIDCEAWVALQARQRSMSEFLLFLLDPARRTDHGCAVPEVHHLAWADRVGASVDTAQKAFAQTEAWASTALRSLRDGRARRCYRAIRHSSRSK